MFRSMGIVCLLFGVAAQAAEIPEMPAAPRPARAMVVNCNNGESLQAAVDASVAPVEILITGICVENVLIRDKDVSLRGTQQPSLDGIQSVVRSTPALTVRGSVIAQINDLSFSNSAGTGLAIRGGANITVNNSLFENNGTVGLRVDSGAFAIGNGLTFTGNPGTNTSTSDAQFFCTGCDFSGGGPAAVSTRGAIVSLLDSVVNGDLGIIADQIGAYVDLDCATLETPHPCSLNVTGPAAIGTFSGTAVLFGAGSFTGQLIADDRGTVRLNGAVQRLSSSDGQPNIVDTLGEIIVATLFDVTPPAQSLLRDTVATHFARVLLINDSVLKGSIQCSGAGDAFLDPTVIRSPGSTVTGCEHGGAR
jgi:hypothetical protein